MLSLLDIAERSQKGPRMVETEWNMSLFRRLAALAKKYELKYPGDGLCINMDDAVADRAFEAAVEFLSTDGVYCISSGRVIQFDDKEVRQAAREAPSRVIVGDGRDQRVITQKKVDGRERLNHTPGHHAPYSEELLPLVVKNFAQIPSGDYLEGCNFAVVDGREIQGIAMEVYAARREAAWLREGVRKAGRPGMAIAYYPINTRAAALIAPMDPVSGLRRTDGILLSVLPDAKVEQDLLAAAIAYEDYGSFKVNGGGAGYMGGFCGDTEGTVIEAIVKSLAGWLCYHDTFGTSGVGANRAATAATIVAQEPKLMWGSSVAFQSLSRHSNLIVFGGIGSSCGTGTRGMLVEYAMRSVVGAVNGANIYISRQWRARMNASQDPLTSEWSMEVADAMIDGGVKREKADGILRGLHALIADQPVERGVNDVRECYDLVNHRPSPEYERIYLSVKEEAARLGLQFA